MKWRELVIEIGAEQREPMEATLEHCGALALTLHDAGDEPLLEPLPGETPMWSQVRLTALFDENVDPLQVEQAILEQHPGFFLQWRTLKNQQWERVWLERFKPRKFGTRLWIIPSGSPQKDGDAVNILMDPGLAFGTGDHPTTAMCLQWLDQADLAGCRVLDYGHGSGILAIAAQLLGAANVVGVDIDPQALIAGNDNARRNHVDQHILFTHDAPVEPFDIVIANILASPLIEMAEKLSRLLIQGGRLALSGILLEQAADVRRAFDPWIQWQEQQQQDGWVLISGTRTADKVNRQKG